MTVQNNLQDPETALINAVPTGAEKAETALPAFTAADIEKAREQEKSKVYRTMETMRSELDDLKKERDVTEQARSAKEAERQSREADVAAQKKAQEESELSFKDLLSKKEQEFQSQISTERLEREKAFALLEQERRYQDLLSYRTQRLEQERDSIVPELIDMISGNTEEEVDQSIALLKDKSNRIAATVQQQLQASRQSMPGARITAPPAFGPLDNELDNQTLTPDSIREMNMTDYAKHRQALLGTAASNRGQGLFS